jgi:hypothetical protein
MTGSRQKWPFNGDSLSPTQIASWRGNMSARLVETLLSGAFFIAMATPGFGASKSDVPKPLKQAGECMLRVLNAESGVKYAHLGVSTDDGWAHVFLEYEASEKTHWTGPTRFDVQKPADPDHGPYLFSTFLPGLLGPGERLDTHVTNRIVEKWHQQCGVSVSIEVG